jgi:hypothetical protein
LSPRLVSEFHNKQAKREKERESEREERETERGTGVESIHEFSNFLKTSNILRGWR